MSRLRHWVMVGVLAMVWALVVAPASAPTAAAQPPAHTPFPCDATYYMMQPAGNATSALGRIAFPTPDGATDTSFQPIATAPYSFNAIGFNPTDNLVYGVINGSADIFRVGANGNFENLGSPLLDGAPVNGAGINAGAFRAGGRFVMKFEQGLFTVDVSTSPPRVLQRGVFGSPPPSYADIVVNPLDNSIYAFDVNRAALVRMELDGDGVTDVVPVGGALPAGRTVTGQGTTWIDGNGRITFLGGSAGTGHIDFYQAAFDPVTRQYSPLSHIGTEPALAGSGDGANCAFRMGFEKNVAPGTVLAGNTATYTYDITNGTGFPRTVTFTDDLRRPGAGGTFVPGSVSSPGGTVSLTDGDRNLVIRDLNLVAGARVRISATVRTPATFSGVLRNQAALTGEVPGGTALSDYPGTPDPGDPTPLTVTGRNVDIEVTKFVGDVVENLVRPGDVFDYTVVATNRGQHASWPVVLADDVPAPLTPVAASDGGTITGQHVEWTFDDLAAGASLSRRITVRVDADREQTVTNRASAAPRSGGEDTNPGNNTSNPVTTHIEIPIPTADLRVTKSAPPTAEPGAPLTYLVTVVNDGPDRSGNATVVDTLPPGYRDVTVTGGGVVADGRVTWNLASLEPGGQVSFEIRGTTPEQGVQLDNEVTVTPDQNGPADPVLGNNSARVSTVVSVPVADLVLTKTGPPTADPGTRVPYRLTVRNDGPNRSPGSVVTDVVPDGFTLAATPEGATVEGATIRWQLGELAAGAERVLAYELVTPAQGGTGVNNATVAPTGAEPVDPNLDNNDAQVSTVVRAPAADLVLTKAGPASAEPGTRVPYTLTVRNDGPDPSADPVVTDLLPEGFALVATPDGATVDGRTVRWQLGALAVGAERVLNYELVAPAEGGTGVNNASVAPGGGGPGDPGTTNNNASVTTTVVPRADLAISKSGPPFADAGARFDWTIEVVNRGPSTARGVVVTDTVPAGFPVGTPTGPGPVATQPNPDGTTTVSFAAGDLAPGATARFTVPVTAPGAAATGTNTATVASATDPDGAPPATSVVPVRGFTVAKTVRSGPGSVRPGSEVVYEIVATNGSAVSYDDATGLATFRDDLSAVLDDAEFVSAAPEAGITRDDGGLTWTGPLGAGASHTVAVTVRVKPGGSGDGQLRNTVVGGTNCPPGSGAPECSPVGNTVRELTLRKTVSAAIVEPGEELTYRVEVTNTGSHSFTDADPAVVSDDLSAVLDDADFGTATAEPGTGTISAPSAGNPVLGWSGPLAAGETVAIVYTVTVVVPQRGDGSLVNTVSSVDDPDCLPGSRCGPEPTLVRAFLLNKTVDRAGAPVGPGEVVTYTVTAVNSGRVDYEEATFAEDLTGVLDDAEVVDVAADAGTVTFAEGDTVLRWSGPLPVADPPGTPGVTITVTVRVDNPADDGDHQLRNVVTGSLNCPPDGAAEVAECTGGDPVAVRGLTVTKTADTDVVHAGGVVRYTVTVVNSGAVDYTEELPAVVVDDMTEVLDDGEYAGDAQADGGAVAFDAGKLTWTGPLAVGATVTITYGIRVADRGSGDHRLRNVVVAADSNCLPGADPVTEECGGEDVLVAELTIEKAADVPNVTEGGRVTYTVTVHNSGAADYTDEMPATWTDDLTDVLDDARYLDDARASTGTTSYEAPVLTWSGPVAAGASTEVTYSVETHGRGDGTLVNTVTGPDSNCPCATRTGVDPKPEPGPRPDPGLASTGVSIFWFVVIGAGLVVAGGGFFLLSALRRRGRREGAQL